MRTRGKQWHGEEPKGAFAHAYFYGGSNPSSLRSILRGLDVRERVFVDLGCGLGKALMIASRFPFKALVGVELLPELAETAKGQTDSNPRIEVVLEDAAKYEFPDEPLVVYLYNPFDADVLAEVLENLRRSLAASPREATIVYSNPVHRDVPDGESFLRVVREDSKHVVYAATLERGRL